MPDNEHVADAVGVGKIPQEEGAEKRLVFARTQASAQHLEFYSNHAQTQMTLWEITLHLGRIVSIKDGNVQAETRASAIMSPEQAMALLQVLMRTMISYQQQYGTLRYPPRDEAEFADVTDNLSKEEKAVKDMLDTVSEQIMRAGER